MLEFVDVKYAQMLSGRFEMFKIKGTNPYRINFRCPICGDSTKNKSKARGWLLEKNNQLFYYCHNCGASHNFISFLKIVDQMSYNDYIAEKFISKNVLNTSATTKVLDKKNKTSLDVLTGLKKVSQLDPNHPVKKYVESRKIPHNKHYKIYYVKKFKTWINTILPGKFENVEKDEPRLVLPFFDKNKRVFGVSARGFNPKGLRYITIMFEDRPKIFGLDTVDFNKPYYIVEGAIDSLFIDNAVAMAGADGNVECLHNVKENGIFVFDAEPRNKEIHKRMEKIVSKGYKICVWPCDVAGKDINEMICNGIHNVQDIIKAHTFQGLEANLKLSVWKKT